MTRDQIKQSIDDFLSLVEKGCESSDANETRLKLLLDRLAMAQHFAAYQFDEKDYPEAPKSAVGHILASVKKRFPNYGYYNSAEDLINNPGKGATIVGDAIDDITDIALDLYETKWRWENNSVEDGLWHFKNHFEMHWGRHLRELQLYLLDLELVTKS
jgi:hypothetical protein